MEGITEPILDRQRAAFEVVVYTDQLWSMNLEDMVLVTEDGCEFLTTLGHVDGFPQMVVIP
jgi:Xaa-Pro aminopeptidase